MALVAQHVDLLPPGSPIDLDTCAREPLHLPGQVQPHGVPGTSCTTDSIDASPSPPEGVTPASTTTHRDQGFERVGEVLVVPLLLPHGEAQLTCPARLAAASLSQSSFSLPHSHCAPAPSPGRSGVGIPSQTRPDEAAVG